MWHRIAPQLAERFTVVVPDLRGYGWSSAPASHNGENYTKRVMGADVVAVMEELGYARFAFVGHDRGARVGYRLALDHPGRLTQTGPARHRSHHRGLACNRGRQRNLAALDLSGRAGARARAANRARTRTATFAD